MRNRAFVTLHDVNPRSWRECLVSLIRLNRVGVRPVTALITPSLEGFEWSDRQLQGLRELVKDGLRLAAHGWTHHAPPPATLFHRAHAALISRDEAEHLSRRREDVIERMRKSFDWFAAVGLPDPEMYVPPAWAMGTVTRADLASLPYRYYETHTGIYDSREGRFTALPLTGFLADEANRVAPLRSFNRINHRLWRWTGRVLRVSIHPPDLRLPLAGDLLDLLSGVDHFVDVGGLRDKIHFHVDPDPDRKPAIA